MITYNASLAGADLLSILFIVIAHSEVVGLLVELGEVHLPRLLSAQTVLWSLGGLGFATPAKWTTEHHRFFLNQKKWLKKSMSSLTDLLCFQTKFECSDLLYDPFNPILHGGGGIGCPPYHKMSSSSKFYGRKIF